MTYHVEILTPCFCAGAEQAKAEIRVPSIRGQLRWWFRALGGSAAEEKAVFGGVHPVPGEARKDSARASAVAVRICGVRHAEAWRPFRVDPNSPESYIWHFASVSADKKRWWNKPSGRRGDPGIPNPDGNVPPGSTFGLDTSIRRGGLPPALVARLDEAVEAFLRFGCIGMRATRGLGAVRCEEFDGGEAGYREAAERLLAKHGFAVKWRGTAPGWRACLAYAGDVLKNQLRAGCKATQNRHSPLGNANPRHASAVYLRPVRMAGDVYRLLVFEAPHERVLPREARRQQALIADWKTEHGTRKTENG